MRGASAISSGGKRCRFQLRGTSLISAIYHASFYVTVIVFSSSDTLVLRRFLHATHRNQGAHEMDEAHEGRHRARSVTYPQTGQRAMA